MTRDTDAGEHQEPRVPGSVVSPSEGRTTEVGAGPHSPERPSISVAGGSRAHRVAGWAKARSRTTWAIVLVLALGLVIALGGAARSLWWPSPEGPEVAIRDLGWFVGAEMESVETIEDKDGCALLPMFICGEQTVIFAVGSVEAYVDFGRLDDKAIKVSQDHRTVDVTLPAPQFGTPKLDLNRSHVYVLRRGAVQRIEGLFDPNTNEHRKLYQRAVTKLAADAPHSALSERTKVNTRKTLETMIRALGYSTVKIHWSSS